MEIYCTRPGCPRPSNQFPDLDETTIKAVPQKYCTTCGMPLILDNRYFPIKLLGQGGFGAAFLARDRRTPNMRRCVVKQFQPSGNLTPDQMQTARKLFGREAEVLEDLGMRHQQIPELLAFFPLDVPGRSGQPDQFFYIVQEFVDGEDMEAELARRGKFSEAEVLEILTEMLKILQFVHDNGSIHRDIKPSNIMRRKDGLLFLLDFGAVKQVTVKAGAQRGRASTGIYSLGFAPQEQMRGDEVYPSTDLYALAVTCVTLLTGKQPDQLYDSHSDTWSWRAHTQVSDRLEAVLNRMLLSTPSQRFQSAKEGLDALRAAPTPVVSPAQPQPQPTRKTALQPPAAPQPAPAPLPIQPATPAPITPDRPSFTLLEVLSGAAFTGFEGGLLAIALASLLGTIKSPLFWLILLIVIAGLIFAQTRRWIEKADLLIVAGVSLLLVWLVPFNLFNRIILQPWLNLLGQPILRILLIAGFTCLIAVAATVVFRLIYNLLSRWL